MIPLVLLGLQNGRTVLTDGVGPLSAPGALPGAMVASKTAFVVLAAGGKPVAVAGPVGSGRALAVGHESYFGAGPLRERSNARFLANAVAWLGGRAARPRVGTLGMPGIDGLRLDRGQLEAGLLGIDVLAIDQGELDGDPTAQAAVVRWVGNGHGILVAGPGWGWQQVHSSRSLRTDHGGNRMLLPFGLGFSDETVDGSPAPSDDPLLQTDAALAALRRGETSPVAVGAVARALALSPPDEGLAKEIGGLAAAEAKTTSAITAKTPFTRLLTILRYRAWEEAAPDKVKPIPSMGFPGSVDPGAKPTTRRVSVDTRVSEWHGTGLYAAPGTVVTVTLPPEAAAKGLGVRIGAHTDELWGLGEWDRFPAISRRWPLARTETRVASPFGGTVFIDVPGSDVSGDAKLGSISVTIAGAVPAPRFVRGETSAAEWQRQLAEPGGPWVELEGRKVILSLPRTAVKDLKDPEPLMAFWDETFEAARELYAAPPRLRPERYAADRQISAGYMHSGYPIMTGLDVANTFADVVKLRGKGATWGFFHELGHNFQEGAWTFDGTGEVTNNLFSLYGSEKLNGITPAEYGVAHPAMAPEARKKRLDAYLAKGARFEDWKSEPFLALTMYAQVREAFGWEPFTRVFGEYRRENLRPQGETAQHDVWMVHLARAVGRDLGPFFQAWGVPTSETARKSIAGLPAWMPSDWPKP